MSHPIVTIEMESGAVMTGELYPELAPNTVNNFIALANSGFYDGLIFGGGGGSRTRVRKRLNRTFSGRSQDLSIPSA